jgi:hypothetical protein
MRARYAAEACRCERRGYTRCHFPVAAERVLLMPQALTADAAMHKSRWFVEACKTRGYGYSTRLHILL